MMSSKKLAFVGNSAQTMINFRYGVMKSLAQSGYSVYVIAPKDCDVLIFREASINFIPIEIDCKGVNPFRDLSLVRQLRTLYKKERFDVVFHYTIKPVIYGGWASHTVGIKQISVITGLGYTFINKGWLNRLVKRLYRSSLSSANEVWFLNQEDRTLFVEQEIVSKFKTRVINGEGVNLEHYKPVTNSSKQKFSFLFIGRVLWDKGVGEFVEAAKVVKKQHPHVQFNVLGPLGASNPASISQEQMEQWERLGVVRYLGETTDVIPYISSASCIVLPSYREGISRVLLESAAMERPIIASNVPGCREIVLNGESGFLCEPQNVSSLIACMMHMLSLSTEDCINFGKKGRMHVKELYDEQLTINLYKNRLNELLPE